MEAEHKLTALEFDGEFIECTSTGRYVLRTDSAPLVFIILKNKDLYVKKVLAPVASAIHLASNTIQVTAVRGFCNADLGIDLGLTVAYMKEDGRVYTRDLVKSGGSKSWTNETLLDSNTSNTGVQAFRLPDFRSAVFVEGSNRIYISPKPAIPT